MELINLAKKREERQPYNAGEAFCMVCKKEWIATAPIGTVWLECPQCGAMKGLYRYSCLRDDARWFCNCGNDLFHVTPKGYYCPNCGEWQTGF